MAYFFIGGICLALLIAEIVTIRSTNQEIRQLRKNLEDETKWRRHYDEDFRRDLLRHIAESEGAFMALGLEKRFASPDRWEKR